MSEPSTQVSVADYGLNFQQQQFCLEYLANGGNGTQAAIYAGYAFPEIQASRLLKGAKVAKFIRDARDEALRAKHMTKDMVLEELAHLAGFDLGRVMTNGGLDPKKLVGEHTRALSAIEPGRYGTKVKTHDKLRALQMLADYLGITKQAQVNVQVNLDFGERMEARRLRALEGK